VNSFRLQGYKHVPKVDSGSHRAVEPFSVTRLCAVCPSGHGEVATGRIVAKPHTRNIITAVVTVILNYSSKYSSTKAVTWRCSARTAFFYPSDFLCKSRDSSVGIALAYELNDRGSRFRLPAGAGNFSLHYRVQNGSGAHPASYPMGDRGSFPGGKAVGA
jgi:hypothetical protein